MKMYTQEGTAVSVIKKIEEGYLAKIIYYTGYDDGNYDEEAEAICEQINFYENLYETPPTEKLAKEVKQLKDEADKLSSQIEELKQLKNTEEYLLNKVSKFPIIKQLADCLTRDFEFILFINSMIIKRKDSSYISGYIRTQSTKNEPFALYELKSDYYISGSDDKPFLVFKTEEEAQSEAKKRLIERFKGADFNYNKSSNLKDWFNKISDSCLAKKDEEFLSVYNSKLSKWEAEERIEKQAKLEKEIQELSKKQKQLQDLTKI